MQFDYVYFGATPFDILSIFFAPFFCFGSIGGWTLGDLSMLYGIRLAAYGLSTVAVGRPDHLPGRESLLCDGRLHTDRRVRPARPG